MLCVFLFFFGDSPLSLPEFYRSVVRFLLHGKNALLLRFGFCNPFSGANFCLLSCCRLFCSRKCLAKILFFLGLVFEIHFRGRSFVLVVLLPPCAFQGCFAYVLAYLLGVFCSRKCLAKILFFLGLDFEIHFRERTLFLLSFCRLVLFGGVLPMFCTYLLVFLFRKGLATILFFLGLVFEIRFRKRTFVFVVLSRSSVFGGVLHMFFQSCWVSCSRECLAKILFFLGWCLKPFLGGFSGMNFKHSFGGWAGSFFATEKPLFWVPESGEEKFSLS